MNGTPAIPPKIAHLTTVDLSLRYLLFPQLLGGRKLGGEVVGISAPGPHVREIEEAGIRHVALHSSTRGMNLQADLMAMLALWRILRRERPHVLHTHNPKPGLYGRIVGRLAGVPLIVNTVHGLYATPDDALPKRLLVYGLEAVAARFSDIELVQSREDYDLLTRWHISPRYKTRHLGNGVDLQRFDPTRFSSDERLSLRAELGANDDTIVVGMVGRLVAEKGYPELFEAARRLDNRYLIVCIGPHDPDKSDALPRTLIQEAEGRGVRLLGMRADVDRLYSAMDLFALPSHREGFPRAAMEAAAMGLPVVASDIRGCREVVEDRRSGMLFPVRDVDGLVSAVVRLGTDADLRRMMSKEAHRRARRHFDERTVVSTVMDSYARVAASKGVPWPRPAPIGLQIRAASQLDAPVLARLHTEEISTGFLPRLGGRFLTWMYRALIDWEGAVVLVADEGRVLGFVAGVVDTARFYRHFLRRYGTRAVLGAVPRLARPATMRRAWETFSYGSDMNLDAELLSTAVAASARRRGIAAQLGRSFLEAMQERSVPEVRVVLGADNEAARGLYESLGFAGRRQTEVHTGEKSLEMVWSRPAS